MSVRIFLTPISFAFLLGCSHHPLPEDFSGVSAFELTQKIRCEARDSITNLVVKLLTHPESPSATVKVGNSIRNGKLRLRDLDVRLLNRRMRELVQIYANTIVTFGFKLTMEEDNNENSGFNLKDPFTNGMFQVSFNAGNEKKRKNIRSYIVSNTFSELHDEDFLEDKFCDIKNDANFIYPITGKIGVEEVLETFLRLSESGGLSAKSDNETVEAALNETLQFRTRIFTDVTPKITLTPITQALHFTEFKGKAAEGRIDDHQVIITVSLPKRAAAVRSAGFKPPSFDSRDIADAKRSSIKLNVEQEIQNSRDEDD